MNKLTDSFSLLYHRYARMLLIHLSNLKN